MKKYTFKVKIEGLMDTTDLRRSKDEAVQKAYDDAVELPKIVYDI